MRNRAVRECAAEVQTQNETDPVKTTTGSFETAKRAPFIRCEDPAGECCLRKRETQDGQAQEDRSTRPNARSRCSGRRDLHHIRKPHDAGVHPVRCSNRIWGNCRSEEHTSEL